MINNVGLTYVLSAVTTAFQYLFDAAIISVSPNAATWVESPTPIAPTVPPAAMAPSVLKILSLPVLTTKLSKVVSFISFSDPSLCFCHALIRILPFIAFNLSVAIYTIITKEIYKFLSRIFDIQPSILPNL